MAKTEPSRLNESPIAILAGSGRLPQILASELVRTNRKVVVVELASDAGPWPDGVKAWHIPPTQISTILAKLREEEAQTIVMAGGMNARPRLRDFRFDRVFFRYARSVALALVKGDDGLLSTAVRNLEREGFSVKGAHEIIPELLAPNQTMTTCEPSPSDEIDIKEAMRAAHVLGAKDKGQAAVARNGVVIALEERSGTAAMLKTLADSGAGYRRSGVLAKVSKPGQELRVDMPAIGPDTILQAWRAGLAGIVIEAGHALLIDREEIIRKANEHGLFVCGRKVDDEPKQ